MKKENKTISYTLRLGFISGVMILAVAVLIGRAVQLQLIDQEMLQQEGNARYLREVEIPANRGTIYDRNEEPVAISTPVTSIWVDPPVFLEPTKKDTDPAKQLISVTKLAQLLDTDSDDLRNKLESRKNKRFVYIRRRVPPHIGQAAANLDLRGLHVKKEYKRFYPAGGVVSQVVGFCGTENIGLEGLESAYNDWMTGRPGKKRVVVDLAGNIIDEVVQLSPASPGKDLHLSIDLRLQRVAFNALESAVIKHKAQSGSIVALNVETGEVLAMANYPTYNPNHPDKPLDGRMKNLAVTDMVEPGSVIKAFTIAAGLESGLFKANSVINTSPGTYRVAGHTVRDVHNYGRLDVTGVITKSSNVGASKIALAIEKEEFWDVLRRFGFGQVTGSGFTGEVAGLLPPYRSWHKVEQATLAYGYRLNVTSLQLARAYAALANNGKIRTPTFLKGGVSTVETVLDPNLAQQVQQMLATVTKTGGTGTRAQVENYHIAGKTGTTKKVGAGGYESNYVASFAGFAPLDVPKVVVTVVIDNPQGEEYYGGSVAAPVFQQVMAAALRLFDVRPDNVNPIRVASLGGGQ